MFSDPATYLLQRVREAIADEHLPRGATWDQAELQFQRHFGSFLDAAAPPQLCVWWEIPDPDPAGEVPKRPVVSALTLHAQTQARAARERAVAGVRGLKSGPLSPLSRKGGGGHGHGTFHQGVFGKRISTCHEPTASSWAADTRLAFGVSDDDFGGDDDPGCTLKLGCGPEFPHDVKRSPVACVCIRSPALKAVTSAAQISVISVDGPTLPAAAGVLRTAVAPVLNVVWNPPPRGWFLGTGGRTGAFSPSSPTAPSPSPVPPTSPVSPHPRAAKPGPCGAEWEAARRAVEQFSSSVSEAAGEVFLCAEPKTSPEAAAIRLAALREVAEQGGALAARSRWPQKKWSHVVDLAAVEVAEWKSYAEALLRCPAGPICAPHRIGNEEGPLHEPRWWCRRATALQRALYPEKSHMGGVARSVLEVQHESSAVEDAGTGQARQQKKSLTRWKQAAAAVIQSKRQMYQPAMESWGVLRLQIRRLRDQAAETARCIGMLEGPMLPLYHGTYGEMVQALPQLLRSTLVLRRMNDRYSEPEQLAGLLIRVANQIVVHAKANILPAGRPLWDRAGTNVGLEDLMRRCDLIEEISAKCQQEFSIVGDVLVAEPGPFENLDMLRIYARLELFCKRVMKLKEVFAVVQQFRQLEARNLDGLGELCNRFGILVQELRGRAGDPCDHVDPRFDRAFLHFVQGVREVEGSLQVFISSAFESVSSVVDGDRLLRKFDITLRKSYPTLGEGPGTAAGALEQKRSGLWEHVLGDLTVVAKQFEQHKLGKPDWQRTELARNAPPVASTVAWVRLLLRHIEEPMRLLLAGAEPAIAHREAKRRAVKAHNTLVRELTQYEEKWLRGWVASVPSTLVGLSVPLLVCKPQDEAEGEVLLNFNTEVDLLLRETRWLGHMGVEVPAAAAMVAFGDYADAVSRCRSSIAVSLRRRAEYIARVTVTSSAVTTPALAAVGMALRPGVDSLTWQSSPAELERFAESFSAAVDKAEDYATQLQRIIQHRADPALAAIANTLLLDTAGAPYSLTGEGPADFIASQDRWVKHCKVQLCKYAGCLERAAADMAALVRRAYDVAGPLPQAQKDAAPRRLRVHYRRLLFKALLAATTTSLSTLRRSVGARRGEGAFMSLPPPLFLVSAHLLHGGGVTLEPSLDEVQRAINRCATAILASSRGIPAWQPLSGTVAGDARVHFFTEIARNKEICKIVLLLTGNVHGLRQQIEDHLGSFQCFEMLWTSGGRSSPHKGTAATTEAFAAELQKFADYFAEINDVPSSHTVASLLINAEPLKCALRAEVDRLMHNHAESLHVLAKAELDKVIAAFDHLERKLRVRVIGSVSDLADMMSALELCRCRAAGIAQELRDVENRYALLTEHHFEVPSAEEHDVGDLRYRWDRIDSLAAEQESHIGKVWQFFRQDLTSAVQKFGVEVITFHNAYEELACTCQKMKPTEVLEQITRFKRSLEEKVLRAQQHRSGAMLFGITACRHPQLAEIRAGLSDLSLLYELYESIESTINKWSQKSWFDLTTDFELMVDEIRELKGKLQVVPEPLKQHESFSDMSDALNDFHQQIPLLRLLTHTSMRDRHWRKLMYTLRNSSWHGGVGYRPAKVAQLLGGLVEIKEELEDLSMQAAKEAHIEEGLRRVAREWGQRNLVFAAHPKGRGEIMLRSDETYEIRDALEESQMQLSALLASRHVAEFREEANQCLARLSTSSENLSIWMEVQASWMHLEAVFAGSDIARQLPQEAKQFQVIDRQWCKIMAKARADPNVLRFCQGGEILGGLPALQEQLLECQRKLSVYLEQKRVAFPRFYFISENILLEILALASDPGEIAQHLPKIFSGVDSLEMRERLEAESPHSGGFSGSPQSSAADMDDFRETQCVAVRSPEEERLQLVTPVSCEGDVEKWLETLREEMCDSVRAQLRAVYQQVLNMHQAGLFEVGPLALDRPAQMTLTGIKLLWTHEVVAVLTAPRGEQRRAAGELRRRIGDALTALIDESRVRLEVRPRRKSIALEAQIVTVMHLNDVWAQLSVRETGKMREPPHAQWEWQRQIRLYWRPEADSCAVCMADAELTYAHEYHGVSECLVITPLIDRCYLTLTQALALHAGGAPIGPAGTGKTETVKDLARLCGRYIVIFNCSDQMDFRVTGRIVRGLAQAGAWGSFDELNRLELPVLSVVAAQLSCVLVALKQRRIHFHFVDSGSVTFGRTNGEPTVGLFITMNPDYAGRHELPQNLRSLFRFVSMMVPERREIIKTKLAAAGFKDNDSLARRFDVLYRVAEEQLSPQRHYDFSLRSVLSVLRSAGPALRARAEQHPSGLFSVERTRTQDAHRRSLQGPGDPHRFLSMQLQSVASLRRRSLSPMQVSPEEEQVIMNVLRDLNLPKLVQEDIEPFEALLSDLFPSARGRRRDQQQAGCRRLLSHVVANERLAGDGGWFEKVVQMYEVQQVRHGLTLIGPPQTGKTTLTRVLRDTLSELDREKNKEVRLNPKAVSAAQFYGHLDPASDEWHPGIFSHLFRKVNSKEATMRSRWWLVCDGPVDPDWIENLNSVLDDNRLLTLANNDRILMAHSTRLLFEVENLNNANPSTVSRVGMVAVSEADLPWPDMLVSLFNVQSQASPDTSCSAQDFIPVSMRGHAMRLYRKHAVPVWNQVRDHIDRTLPSLGPRSCFASSVSLLCAMAAEFTPAQVSAGGETFLERLWWLSVAWAVGSLGGRKGTELVDQAARAMASPMSQPPEGSSLIDLGIEAGSGQWEEWDVDAGGMVDPPSWDESLFVESSHTVALSRILDTALRFGLPVLVVGQGGIGKSVTVGRAVGSIAESLEMPSKKMRTRRLSLWHSQTPEDLQTWINDLVEKQGARKYGPRGGGKMCVFLDDVGMPARDDWGDSPVAEMLRQLIEFGVIWSLERMGEYKTLVDISWSAVMPSKGSAHCSMPLRLRRHFCILQLLPPTHDDICRMFDPAVESHFDEPTAPFHFVTAADLGRRLLSVTARLWELCRKDLAPGCGHQRLAWSLRDIARVMQGMLFSVPEACQSEADLVVLWRHECSRMITGRLGSAQDREWVEGKLAALAEEHLGRTHADTVRKSANEAYVPQLNDSVPEHAPGAGGPLPLVSTLLVSPQHSEGPSSWGVLPPYIRAESSAHLCDVYQALQARLVEGGQMIPLVIFEAAAHAVVRIARVLFAPRGSVLLIGDGGQGRQNLALLAAYSLSMPSQTLVKAKDYTAHEFGDIVRDQCRRAVLRGETALVLRDTEMRGHDLFLDTAAQLLSSGDANGLFAQEDRDEIRPDLVALAQKHFSGVWEDTDDWLWNLWSQRLRDSLHLVLCLSPTPPNRFALWLHRFPSLVSECVSIWLPNWPRDAYLQVATARFKKMKFVEHQAEGDPAQPADVPHNAVSTQVYNGLLQAAASVPDAASAVQQECEQRYRRIVHFTPRTYTHFLRIMRSTYAARLVEVSRYGNNVQTGLTRLRDTERDVEGIKKQVREKEENLSDAMRQHRALRADFYLMSAEAEQKRAEASRERNRLAEEAEVVKRVKKSAESDFIAAQPALSAARAALEAITPGDIKTVKGLISPPIIVRHIMDAVSVLMQEPISEVRIESDGRGKLWLADSWQQTGRHLVQRIEFLQMLEEFNVIRKDYINEETLELLEPYLCMDEFNEERARKACGNVAGLCSWVRAMYEYYWIAKDVEPKKRMVREAEANWRQANKKLEVAQQSLDRVEKEVSSYAKKLQEQERRQKELQDESAALCRTTDAANLLIDALSGEKDRWTQQSRSFRDQLTELPGECLVVAAFIAYGGPFVPDLRQRLFSTLVVGCTSNKVPLSNVSEVRGMLQAAVIREGVDETVEDWMRQGLPSDVHSVQNALFIHAAMPFEYPFLVDPQGQGKDWLLNRVSKKGGQSVRISDPSFLGLLTHHMQEGFPLIVEGMEMDVPAVLAPVLSRAYHRSGSLPQVLINDRLHDVAQGFEIYLCTKAVSPQLAPELESLVLVVDFTVTQDGLEQQLLQRVLETERADLERERAMLDRVVEDKRRNLRNMEDQLLVQISQKDTSLVDDDHLMHTLAGIKNAQNEVHDQLASAQEARLRIHHAREEYRPAAVRGSVLYSVMVEMAKITPVYHTSLSHFLVLFDKGVATSAPHDLPSRRMEAIIAQVTRCVFLFTVRGLMEDHKALFSLLLACKVGLRSGHIRNDAFMVFLRGGGALLPEQIPDQPDSARWLSQRQWLNCLAASRVVSSLRILCNALDYQIWKVWYEDEVPENAPLPHVIRGITAFERLVLVRCLREDRTLLAARGIIDSTLGPGYADAPSADLDTVCQEAGPYSPILFLLSAGSDPPAAVHALGKRHKKQVMSVSIGQGQEEQAWVVVHDALHNGGWALLQNAHFGMGFIARLGEHLEQLRTATEGDLVSPEARIWITTEANPNFPTALLDRSIKITESTAQGLRAGVQRLWSELPVDTLLAFRRGEYKQLLYCFCFLHCALQGRRRFGPLGWARQYDFDSSDHNAAVAFLQSHFASIGDDPKRGHAVGYDCLRHMLAGVYYGGRVTDEGDRRVLRAVVTEYLGRIRSQLPTIAPGAGSGVCIVPRESDAVELQHCLESIPLVDSPQFFGLHNNAGLTQRAAQGNQLLALIRDVQPRDLADEAEGITSLQRARATAERLQQQIPQQQWRPEWVQRCLERNNIELPLTTFLGQEATRLQTVIDRINADVRLTQTASSSDVVAASPTFQEVYDALSDAIVPAQWAGLLGMAPSSTASVLQWAAQLGRRHKQLHNWLDSSRPTVYWLGGFLSPRGFVSAVVQECARAKQGGQGEGWSLDRVAPRVEVTRMEPGDVERPPHDGAYISGVVLEGAGWHQPAAETRLIPQQPIVGVGRLRDQFAKENRYNLPVLLVTAEEVDPRPRSALDPTEPNAGWSSAAVTRRQKTRQIFHCPLFRSPQRGDTNLVCTVRLPSEEESAFWVLRGVAAVCNPD